MVKNQKYQNILITVMLLCLPLLAGCGQRRKAAEQAGLVSVTDDAGRAVSVTPHPGRIISFAPSITELVYALGGEGRLAGVTAWCNYPPQARRKPSVGDYANPNLERIAALQPDLVLMIGSRQSPILGKLEALGIPVIVLSPESTQAISGDIRLLGRLLDRQRQADSLVSAIDAGIRRLAEEVANIPLGQRPKVFVEIADQPLMTAGGGSFVGQLVAMAGGINVCAGLPQPYGVVNAETVIKERPDVILILHPAVTAKQLAQRIGWQGVPAVMNHRVREGFDLDVLLRPGPRYIQGARALHGALYGKE
jgi:iron complex transport system substrate-binding protein